MLLCRLFRPPGVQKQREIKRQQVRQRREQAHQEALAAKKQSIMASPRPGGPTSLHGGLRLVVGGRCAGLPCREAVPSSVLCATVVGSCPPAVHADPRHLPGVHSWPAVLGRQRGSYQADLDGAGEEGDAAQAGREGSPPLEYALRADVSSRWARWGCCACSALRP